MRTNGQAPVSRGEDRTMIATENVRVVDERTGGLLKEGNDYTVDVSKGFISVAYLGNVKVSVRVSSHPRKAKRIADWKRMGYRRSKPSIVNPRR